ncbi:hypothetical protein HN371_29350 [Candidatus Poribacteria bacterium]|jgi:hypothetical protein|nr:hypothetical protein [Candidatus Poribacteria bacterium]MBT7096147.1 hypothetical protein [Candidatus Poribacteria bacterium]
MAVSPRFSEAVANDVEAMFDDDTIGLGARCTNVNTRTADKYTLPTKWTSDFTQQTTSHLRPPFFETYTSGIRADEVITVGTNEFEIDCIVKCWLPDRETRANWTAGAKLYRRLEWAIMELMIERRSWDGRTLNAAARILNVLNIRVEPMIRWDTRSNQMGGVGAQVSFTVTIAEEDVYL